MADYTRNYNFQANTTIQSSQVDEEFDDVATAIASKPDADTTLQTNLNADQVDGYDVSSSGGDGNIPVCGSTLQVGLNAEKLGGATLADISQAGFTTGTAMLFYQASAPSGWTKSSDPTVDRVIGVSSSGTGGSENSTTSWGASSGSYTVTVAAHTLTIAEVPAVTLSSGTLLYYSSAGGDSSVPYFTGTGNPASLTSTSLSGTTDGGGGSHTHAGSTVIRHSSYRPPIRWVIICTKD